MTRHVLPPVLVLALATVLLSCEPSAEDEANARGEIQTVLEEFLPVLGQAYAERDALKIRPWVAEKEIARVGKRIEELTGLGQVFVPTFRQLTIEDVRSWNSSNAFVSTVEVWDLHSTPVGSDVVLSEVLGQVNRVKYQMKRDPDGWRILYRTIVGQVE